MATDNTQPRVGLIFQIGIGMILTLVVLRAALGAYFDKAAQAEELRKVGEARPVALINLRTDEKERLSGGAMPIDKAMGQLASQGRKSMGPDLMPTVSKDIAPLQGWAKMPLEVPPAMMAKPAATASSAADAGVSAGLDAGAFTLPPVGVKKNKP